MGRFTGSRVSAFTLLELIVVMALLGALAVFAASRFTGTAGFAEYTYQARIIAALRATQQRAMQDSRPGFCFRLVFVPAANGPPGFGPPSDDYSSGNEPATCSTDIDFSTPEYLRSGSDEMSEDAILLDVFNGTSGLQTFIGFDSLGRPSSNDGNCTTGCRVEISGESTVSVCVQSEGYIHAC